MDISENTLDTFVSDHFPDCFLYVHKEIPKKYTLSKRKKHRILGTYIVTRTKDHSGIFHPRIELKVMISTGDKKTKKGECYLRVSLYYGEIHARLSHMTSPWSGWVRYSYEELLTDKERFTKHMQEN
jgi:hypothetical protein